MAGHSPGGSVPTTLQELDEAVKKFQVSDLGSQALPVATIQDASLAQLTIETDKNLVAGGDGLLI
jgi:hypothetical protein